MSTRQRFTHETTVEPGATLLLSRAVDGGPTPVQDIGARRLRELAERLSHATAPSSSSDDDTLDETDTEFGPVSLATIRALANEQASDESGDAPAIVADLTPAIAPAAPIVATSMLPAAANDEVVPTTALAAVDDTPPAEPLRLTSEDIDEPEEIEAALPDADDGPPTPADDGASDSDHPLMLADQSAPDIRLVDLIRRQQSLLDQLNRFPPSYAALSDRMDEAAEPEDAAEPTPQSVVELLAPPPSRSISDLSATEAASEAPPPLPPVEKIAPPPPRLSTLAVRVPRDEPSEVELPEQSPIIIQRARAERSGRRLGPAVAAPPSAVPAFLGGLAVALVVAGVLFAVL